MSLYTADSLEAIAAQFDRMAKAAAVQADSRPTLKGRAFEQGRASVWLEAAQMLRATTLKEGSK